MSSIFYFEEGNDRIKVKVFADTISDNNNNINNNKEAFI